MRVYSDDSLVLLPDSVSFAGIRQIFATLPSPFEFSMEDSAGEKCHQWLPSFWHHLSSGA